MMTLRNLDESFTILLEQNKESGGRTESMATSSWAAALPPPMGVGKGSRGAMAPLDFHTLSLKPLKFQKFYLE